MKQFTFKNKWYPILLIIVILYSLLTRGFSYISTNDLVSLVHLVFTCTVIGFLIFRTSFTEILVKIWAGLSILGGAMGCFSVLMLLLIGFLDGKGEHVNNSEIITHSLNFFIGIVIIMFWRKSVLVTNKNKS